MTKIESDIELNRLISAFEAEAARFPALTFHTMFITEHGPSISRKFLEPNHSIMLWQYIGVVTSDGAEAFVDNIEASNLQFGIRGAQISMFGVLEGSGCHLFRRMAERAAALFDDIRVRQIQSQIVTEILKKEAKAHPSGKPMSAINHAGLSVWLNYLLYHLSMTNPGSEKWQRITPDPFTLSLLALERLKSERGIGKIDRSSGDVSTIRFKVALSFPGEQRHYVSKVAEDLRGILGKDTVFYDHDYQAQLARPNLDTLLQGIYHDRSDLVVIFLCKDYASKEWCGLEWRGLRDLIKQKQDSRIMFIRFDEGTVDGTFSIDGAIDARTVGPQTVAKFVIERLNSIAM